jgi:hypothetical protein
MNRRGVWAGAAALAVLAAAALVPVGGGPVLSAAPREVKTIDLGRWDASAPGVPLDLVFLHHSIGSHLLADPGPDDGKGGVHPNGGGLRKRLVASGYRVHEATYGSKLGEHTDLFDWLPKFRGEMDAVLRIDHQDKALAEGTRNRVVMFKSCFPNNYFREEGVAPGNPQGPELTLANAQATMRALLPLFAARPDTLFVFLTTPPNVGIARGERLGALVAKKVLGRPSGREQLATHGALARRFNDWAASPDGWLGGYKGQNVAVYHLYDRLTAEGSNFTGYATGGGMDDHPSSEGLGKAAEELVPFLNRAVRRAGLAPPGMTGVHVDTF